MIARGRSGATVGKSKRRPFQPRSGQALRRGSQQGRISRLRWADGTRLRGSREGVKGAEIEEVLRWDPYLRTDGATRTLAYGATSHGRLLLVVLRRAGPGDLRVVAARDLTERESHALRARGT